MRPPLVPASRRRLAAKASALSLLLAPLALWVLHAAPSALEGLAYLLPTLLLALTLAARRYPGERALLALAATRRRRGERVRRCHAPARAGAPRALLPRGGRLLGASLAVRPPPRPLSAFS